MTQLVNQTVLVTGANRGMGREFVRQLLGRGVAKVYAAARDPQTIVADDPRVVPLQLDVTDTATLRGELETNLFGTLAVTSAFADRLAQRSGIVINMASVASWLPTGGT